MTDNNISLEALQQKESVERMKKYMTDDEQMQVAFVPLIIQHIIFSYAFNFTRHAASNKVEKYKKQSRRVKQLYDELINDMRRDLDHLHLQKVFDESDNFLQACARDMTIMYFSVNSEIKKKKYRIDDNVHTELYTYAFITLELIRYMERYIWRMNELLAEKIGMRDDAVLNPFIQELRKVMNAVVAPMTIDASGHVATCVRIFDNQIGSIRFEKI